MNTETQTKAVNKIMSVLRQKNISIAHSEKGTDDLQIAEIEIVSLMVKVISDSTYDADIAKHTFSECLKNLKETKKEYKIKLFGEDEAKRLFPRYFEEVA